MNPNEKNTLDEGANKVKYKPKYGEYIIVLVQYRNSYQWFVTDKDIWFLDLRKLINAYMENGFHIPYPNDFSERFNIPVVDEDTAKEFFENIRDQEVKVEEFQNMLEHDIDIDVSDMYPALYVNFDQKVFISCYPEPASYELYIPDGWNGHYQDFIKDVPEKYRYWMIEGKNVFYP